MNDPSESVEPASGPTSLRDFTLWALAELNVSVEKADGRYSLLVNDELRDQFNGCEKVALRFEQSEASVEDDSAVDVHLHGKQPVASPQVQSPAR